MSVHEDTSAKISSRASEIVRQVPAVRWSQSVVCNSLSVLEALLVGMEAGLVLACIPGIAVSTPLAALGGGFVTLCVMFFAARYGAANYEGFFSRRALLPGAATSGLTAAIAVALLGASPVYVAFSFCALFTGVYIAKLPSIAILKALQNAGLMSRLVAIASDDPDQRQALSRMLRDRDDIQIVFSGSPSSVPALRDLVRENLLDEIILPGAPLTPEPMSALAGLAVTVVRITPTDKFEHWSGGRHHGKRQINRWNAPAAIIAEPPIRDWNSLAKRLIDICAALIILVPVAPVMLLCAIAIKLDSRGPVFFIQRRIGYRDKPFEMYKFRSMYAEKSDHACTQFTLRNDPRVTRMGAILRRTSADELPQILNVLLGDMSLVGPRPHPRGVKAGTTPYDELIPEFYSRYRMKPGITGLAQVRGQRGSTETPEALWARYESDLDYAAEWTPLMDVIILMRTVFLVFGGRNAY